VAAGGGGSVPAASLPVGAHPLSGQVTMLASTVSSKFLGALAAAEGFTFEETLTGFKWMGSRTEELRAAGGTLLFSYEEAIGFCIGDVVKDKDGVIAAAVFLELAAALRVRGEARWGAWWRTFGFWLLTVELLDC
jgi:phosphomannomutase